ncbi:atp-binding cassette superfamily [Plasmopara halstedii]|uniref:Atp-binding cassette superfamily n=1 Tax=Plasmopara halstedii TaxID=4781 RepID=A0A0P1ALR9_PLAHL|nr:atp-binding cassette superfamily [Plasmopara halstedii]CEG42369.1 atp-binding cassette superfamily [Plasmopara halstedii]|eukprot:XP_024578738.1 atp-binding cassette superfamily [Plasmopara halstedii]
MVSPRGYAILENRESVTKPQSFDFEMKIKYEGIRNPCVLSWTDLSYMVKIKQSPELPRGTKTILDRVSGRCAPGEITAIMGPSGSGKTTLVDMLADRISSADVSGVIEVNGAKRDSKTFRVVTSYVAQDDTLLGSFTVIETMRMAARLSVPSSVTSHEIEIRVENIMDAMGLSTARDTLVGDIFRKGLSGGQKRRLSIAIELLSDPSILILDEPTSGLDSSAAHNVMKFVLKLCAEGKTVVCTVHQPSSLVYEMFTNVIILSAGQTVYCGPRATIIPHFASHGYDCPHYMNPAEYFISLVNTDFDDHAEVSKLIYLYTQSTANKHVQDAINRDRTNLTHLPNIQKRPPSALRQFNVLMHRNMINNIRNPGIYWIRLFMYFCLSLMVGTMYLSSNNDLSEEDLVPMLFYVQAFLVFMSVAVLPFFIEQRTVFARERANNSLSVCFAESMMHVIGAAVPHYIIGIALGAGVFGMFMLCEGFMVPRNSIPSYWKWGYYLAFHSLSFESFVFKQFEKSTTREGKAILIKYGMEDVDVTWDMFLLVGYICAFQTIFAFILWKFHTGRR